MSADAPPPGYGWVHAAVKHALPALPIRHAEVSKGLWELSAKGYADTLRYLTVGDDRLQDNDLGRERLRDFVTRITKTRDGAAAS